LNLDVKQPSAPASTQAYAAPKIRILLVEDHPLVRRGFADVICGEPDLELCAEAARRSEVVAMASQHHPDLIVLDLWLGGYCALDLIGELSEAAHVLVLSMQAETVYAERALAVGALGYIMKHEAIDEILLAIRTVAAGKVYASATIKDDILRSISARRSRKTNDNGMHGLSDRELEVFALIGRGLPTREIAKLLFISRKTVETHRENIKRKLGVKLSSELAVRAAAWLLAPGGSEHSAATPER
jgi:DNA-binding NarL/FixJ family response regulator